MEVCFCPAETYHIPKPSKYEPPDGTCMLCDNGTHSSSIGSTLCYPCQPGSFSPHKGMTSCFLCNGCKFGRFPSPTDATCTSTLDVPYATYLFGPLNPVLTKFLFYGGQLGAAVGFVMTVAFFLE